MTSRTNVAPHLLLSIIQIAREECSHGKWQELEPILAVRWESLRDNDTPSWDVVVEEIEHACRREGAVRS